MSEDVAHKIAEKNKRWHTHNASQDRCKQCSSFVDKGTPENGQVRYFCESCQQWLLEYVGTRRAAATSD